MNGLSPAARGNQTTRLQTAMRDHSDRLRMLEGRKRVTIGDWVLSQDTDTGALVATNASTGAFAVVALANAVKEET